MCQFIESIRVEGGRIYNLELHNKRFNETRRAFFGVEDFVDLADYISPQDIWVRTKCRILYDRSSIYVEYIPYKLRQILSLRIVSSDVIHYDYKFYNRRDLSVLYAQKGDCDDVLIVRNGLLTDSSICNVAFGDGLKWFSPRYPLLRGTKRAQLLNDGCIFERDMSVCDLSLFKSVRLFNALIEFGEIEIPISRIVCS